MNRKRYETTVRFFSENKIANTFLLIIYKALPYIVFVAYPALLIYKFFEIGYGIEWQKLILVTVMRVVINEARPYEKYGMDSVFHKTTVRKSMPSRHTASAYIIAMTFLSVNLPLGIVALCFASMIEASRVMAGAHFIRDVVVGALIGITAGVVFYFIL